MNKRPSRWMGVIAAAVVSWTATGAHALDLPKPKVTAFSMSAFEHNIREAMDGRTIGYAYAIYQNGVLKKAGGGGKAVLPSTNMTENKRGELFSMSKTITAVALMRALEIMQARGEQVTIWSSIASYLPPEWEKGPGVDGLTFREVLRHESGLIPYGQQDLYDSVRLTIEHGVDPALAIPPFGNKLYSYCGCNFALLRILIPRMLWPESFDHFVDPDEMGIFHGSASAGAFVDFVRRELFWPAGFDASVDLSGPLPYTRYYDFWDTTQSTLFEQYTPRYLYAGAGFFYMSVKEFALFLERLRRGQVIAPGSWQIMRDHWLGLYHHRDAWTDDHGGDFLTHNGGASVLAEQGHCLCQEEMGGGGAWVMFPNGVTVVAFHNSIGRDLFKVPILDTTAALETAFRDAYITLAPLP